MPVGNAGNAVSTTLALLLYVYIYYIYIIFIYIIIYLIVHTAATSSIIFRFVFQVDRAVLSKDILS